MGSSGLDSHSLDETGSYVFSLCSDPGFPKRLWSKASSSPRFTNFFGEESSRSLHIKNLDCRNSKLIIKSRTFAI